MERDLPRCLSIQGRHRLISQYDDGLDLSSRHTRQGLMMKIDGRAALRPASIPMSAGCSVGSEPVGRASPERLKKGNDFKVFEGTQRLCGPIVALQRSGEIDGSHVSAAERWYRDYVLGVEGVKDPEARRTGKAPDIHAGMLSRVAACERHRGVRNALGFCAEVRLRLMLLDELSFSAMAERLMPKDGNGRKKVAAQMAFLLEQLAEHYQAVDQRPTRDTRLTKLRAGT